MVPMTLPLGLDDTTPRPIMEQTIRQMARALADR